jgi:Flp pilus assembly protein TadG
MHVTRLRDDRGGILVLAAVTLPIFLLICALVVDAGNWFTHKRQLQNRADAGALAAGVEYLSQLQSCQTNPSGAGDAIADAAKRYAGDPDAAGPKYNQEITNDDDLLVAINRTTFADSDGNPCDDHAANPDDTISPNGGVWTDVKVRESNIGTLFRAFGINLPSISARARVEVNQITGLSKDAGALPFVHETGDYVDCVWAEFVDAANPGTKVSLIGATNPVALTPDPTTPRRWTTTTDVGGITFPNGKDDLAVKYWMGVATGGNCDFSTDLKSEVTSGDSGSPVPIDWINVYNNDSGGGGDPQLHSFQLRPGSCGSDRVGFLYSSLPCAIEFSAWVDGSPAPDKITVISSNSSVAPADATPGSTSGSETQYKSSMTFDPNAVTGDPGLIQDYTQVGRHLLKVRWTMSSGQTLTSSGDQKLISPNRKCTTGNPCVCKSASPCVGEFRSEFGDSWQQQTYVADPVNSSPLYYAELLHNGSPMQNSYSGDDGHTGPFKIVLTNTGVDKQHVVLIRKAVQGTGNRTLAINCGQGKGGGLDDAIANGCPKQMLVNKRGDSCDPAQDPTLKGAWDCVEAVSGNKNGIVGPGMKRRFASPCTPNNWATISANPGDPKYASDPRFAYIFLTTLGQTQSKHGWYPIKAFLRVYVTGGDGMGCQDDDEPPRGYNGKGEQLWGHLVDFVTLSDDAITGAEPCDIKVAIVNCKPALVR